MKEDSISKKIEELKRKAKKKGKYKSIFTSTGTALNQVIRNEEQADLFMKRLKALD